MNILVTGGAGYIGSHCVRHLLAAGHAVAVLDNLSSGHAESLAGTNAFLYGKVLSAAELDAVIHFAGLSQVGESVSDPGKYYWTNVGAAAELLNHMRRDGVHSIVFSSSAAVYGSPSDMPIHEDHPLAPVNPYGRTKLMVEQMLADYAAAYGFRVAILRYFNAAGAAYGIGEDHRPETHLIPLVLQVALGQRESITINGDDYPTPDGTCVRDFVHVEDLAAAHLAALGSLNESPIVCNLGSGRGYSVREVIETCREVTGHEIPVKIGPRREGDPPALVADISKAAEVLGWKPKHDLRSMVESAWQWHKSHPQGFV